MSSSQEQLELDLWDFNCTFETPSLLYHLHCQATTQSDSSSFFESSGRLPLPTYGRFIASVRKTWGRIVSTTL